MSETDKDTAEAEPELLVCVIPCNNEAAVLPLFLERTRACLQGLDIGYRLLFVDDGSSDETLDILSTACSEDPHCQYISFSRNFGKEAAVYAGLEEAVRQSPDYVALMDADLQDPPELLSQMLAALRSGKDCAAACRNGRDGEPRLRSFLSGAFYRIMTHITKLDLVDGARDFRIMRADVVRSVLAVDEKARFSKGIFQWVGYETEWIPYEYSERAGGGTSWKFTSLVAYAFDGLLAYSIAPLVAISIIGLVAFILSIALLLVVFIRALAFGDPVSGWPSLMCALCLFGSLILLVMGIFGLYLSKVYVEVKNRPIYLIAKRSK